MRDHEACPRVNGTSPKISTTSCVRTGDFLRSRPVMHNMPLTVIKNCEHVVWTPMEPGRGPGPGPSAARSQEASRAIFHRAPHDRVTLTNLSPEQADILVAHLVDLGHSFSSATADQGTATALPPGDTSASMSAASRMWRS